MIEPPPLTAASFEPREPQQTSVPGDLACDRCGYNLRGQSAAWDRAAARWRVRCPECGSTQALNFQERRTGDAAGRWFVLVLTLLAALALWTLLGWIAAGESASILSGQTTSAPRTPGARIAAGLTPPDLLTFAIALGTHGMRIALSAMAVGGLVALSPWALERQRTLLLVGLLGIGCAVGVWMSLTGYVDPFALDLNNRIAQALYGNPAGYPLSASTSGASTWQYKFAGGVYGAAVAFVFGRLGQFFGRPLARSLASMFLPPEMRPAFLRPASR